MKLRNIITSVFLLIASALACSSQPESEHRVGAVLGQSHWSLPAGMTNPATADAGLVAAVGDIYTAADLSHSFVRFGVNNTDWQPFPGGSISATQAAVIAGGNPVAYFQTPTMDFTALSGTAQLTPGGLTGKKAVFVSPAGRILFTVSAGTLTVAPVFSFGTNSPTCNNWLTGITTTSTTNINGGTVPFQGGLNAATAIVSAVDLGSPVCVTITTAAAGGALSGILSIALQPT